jgi:hypothetical protein
MTSLPLLALAFGFFRKNLTRTPRYFLALLLGLKQVNLNRTKIFNIAFGMTVALSLLVNRLRNS